MADGNDRYEFNAPKHYFDFTKDDVEVDESFFDCPLSAEPMKEEKKQPVREQSEEIQQPQEAEIPTTASLPAETPKRQPAASHQETDKPEELKGSTKVVKPVKGRKSEVAVCGVRQSPRLAAICKALRRSNAARRSSGGGQSRTSASPGASSQLTRVAKVHSSNKHPVRKASGVSGLSEEDKRQLETIAKFKNKLAENKKKKDATAQQAVRTGPTKPEEFQFATNSRLRQKPVTEEEAQAVAHTKVNKPLGPTKPQEFQFATDSRLKNTKQSTEKVESVDFIRSLRSSTTSLNKEPVKGPTIPQPFNLTETHKGKKEESTMFVSMAELNMKFHIQTPLRFRSKRAGSVVDPEPEAKKNQGHGVTIPHTPNLTTRSRSRNLNYPTQEEREVKEYEEAQKLVFKAKPVNRKALEPPSTGYQVEVKCVTAPEPFNLTETKKYQAPILDFKLQEMLGSTSSLASLPHGGVPQTRIEKAATKIQPFSFDSRDKARFQQKEEKIKKVIEDEKKLAEFHANPMPAVDGAVRGLPPKRPPTPTRLQPFNLQSDKRGAAKQEQFKRQLEEEKREDNERRKFLAHPDTVLHRQPFIPDKSSKPLTDISGFTLNTELRAEERTNYELHRKMKEDEIQAAKREKEERKKAEEAEEIARIRREAVHKAKPVPNYKPMVIEPASKPLTAPQSPNFATDTRLRGRATRSNSTLNISSATFTAE